MEVPIKKRHYYKVWLGELSQQFWLIRKRPWVVILAKLFLLAFLAVLIGGVGVSSALYFYTGNLKDDHDNPLDFSKIKRGDFKRASYVYDHSGKKIIGRFFYEIRDPISVDEIPDMLAKAFVAAEDQRFFSPMHLGIDPIAITRAAFFNNLHDIGIKYGPKSGASGISQQVARLAYAEEVDSFKNRERSWGRKFVEAQVAIQLIRRYDKNEILATFLNQIYFGHGVNGIAEARRYYFGKDLKDGELSLREIAILVSLNKSPAIYCPVFHQPAKPELKVEMGLEAIQIAEAKYEAKLAQQRARIILARERYNWVLGRMLDKGFIAKKEYSEALFKKDEPMELAILHITPLKDSRFGYGNRMIKEMLLGQGYSDEEITLSQGLHIKTSFDSEIQRIMMEEMSKQLEELNKELPPGEDRIEGSFVAIENKTGRIVALSGGHDFSETQYNRALALRSPGSAFKPIVFAAAFEFAGKTFDDLICNCSFARKGANGKIWAPQNFPEENPVPKGYRPLPQILIRSVNLGTLMLAMEIGMDPIIEIAHRLGIWGERGVFKNQGGDVWFKVLGAELTAQGLDPRLPTAIGASGVSLLELVNAYTVFARGGTYIQPSLILEINDANGKKIYEAKRQSGQRVLSEDAARKVTILLRAVTKVGTTKISMRGIEQQVAAKTGTANGPDDASLIWLTPEYTFGMRVGYDQPKPIALPQYMKKMAGRESQPVSAGWVLGFVARAVTDRIYAGRSTVPFSIEVEEGVAQLLEKFEGKI